MHIALVLCTCNGARFLSAQLDSLMAQTRLPDTIIVCDDTSTDASMTLLQTFADGARARGIHVLLHRQPVNLGYIHNFSDALRRATGDVVFLCDQDDLWHPEKIARMTDEFARRPDLQLLHTDARLVDADGQPLHRHLFQALRLSAAEREAEHTGQSFNVLLRRNTVTGATAALRHSVIQHALPVPAGWIHDEWLALCASLHGEVDCLEWASIDYRQHAGNQIGIRYYSFREPLTHRLLSKRKYIQQMVMRLETIERRHQEGTLALTPDQANQLQAQLLHAKFRAHLPASWWLRIQGIVREAASGRYQHHAFGMRSIISDLIHWR